MIGLVEGAKRQKTPNEIALTILLAALTVIFLFVCMTLKAVRASIRASTFSITVLVALLVCLIPTTIGGLLSAIGIAGIDRLVQKNVLAMSGRAVEAAGDVDVLLLDKTGTITLGNRQAAEFIPAPGVTEKELADAAQLSSLADETPEGRSIVVLAKEKYGLRGREIARAAAREVRPVHRADAHERRGCRWRRSYRKGAAACDPRVGRRQAADGGRDRRSRRISGPAARRWWWRRKSKALGVDLSQGHRQRRPGGALRAVPRHGHPHGDDHRRQQADRRGHRRGSRRG